MSTWTDYWRLVTPRTQKQNYTVTDTIQMHNDAGHPAFTSYSWYSQLMKGAGSRLTKYLQYDGMDGDIDVSRAIDIIAEEMATVDEKSNMPFEIEYQNEPGQQISENMVTTIRAACRHWSNFQDFENRVFRIARTTVKYGDCFFRKSTDLKRWEYLDPANILGIELNDRGEKVAFHIKRSNLAATVSSSTPLNDIVPASAVIHFTLCDDMGPVMPFGESILEPIKKTFKQLGLLEDACIIYRIVRAPERRVFYIDVGNMPAMKVKQYLNQVRLDMRQKRTPNTTGGGETVDSVLDPFCLDMATMVPLLDGRTLSIAQLTEEYHSGKTNWAYSMDPSTGIMVPGLISWAGQTKKNAEVIKLTLDNGTTVICTPDHKFPIKGRGKVEAKDIRIGEDSLFPLNRRHEKIDSSNFNSSQYEQIWNDKTQAWEWSHRLVANWAKQNDFRNILIHKIDSGEYNTVHHFNCQRFDNSPENLFYMNNSDHIQWHADNVNNQKRKFSKEIHDRLVELAFENNWKKKETFRAAEKDELFVSLVSAVNQSIPGQKFKIKYNVLGDKFYKNFYPAFGYAGWKDFKGKHVYGTKPIATTKNVVFSQEMVSRLIELVKISEMQGELLNKMSLDTLFMEAHVKANSGYSTNNRCSLDKPSYKLLVAGYNSIGVTGWKQLKQNAELYNHKVISIEPAGVMDVGTLTIDGGEIYHGHHNFAIGSDLSSCIYTQNSTSEDFFFPVTTSGRGSRVETLPGGENLGDLPEVKYFQSKIFRGLRIPMSYLSQAADGGATVQDGKMGVAYIEELRFANYVRRLQNKIEKVFDEQFKLYLLSTGIKVDNYLFKIKLPEPQNFALYRQAALDGDLINTFQSAEGIKFLSKRYIMKRYLGMSEDDIQSNEVLLKQERGILDDAAYSDIRQIYDPKIFESWPELDLKDVAQGPAQSAEDMNNGGEGGGEGGEEDTGGGEPSGGGPGDLGIEPEEAP